MLNILNIYLQISKISNAKPLEEKVKLHRNKEETNPEDISWINNMQNDLPSNFDQNRHKGENDSCICQLIRNDSIDDFIVYINQKNISHQSTIEMSIYETNPFLIQMKTPTLIEYAFFYGSSSIINYLKMSGVELTPSLWIYSIHSQDPNVFQILEENKVPFPNEDYFVLLKESIKCHHNDFANYFMENYYQDDEIKSKKNHSKKFKILQFRVFKRK